MTKKDYNRIGFDTRTQEFTVTLAQDTASSRIPREDFISEESQHYQNMDFLFFFLDKVNSYFKPQCKLLWQALGLLLFILIYYKTLNKKFDIFYKYK